MTSSNPLAATLAEWASTPQGARELANFHQALLEFSGRNTTSQKPGRELPLKYDSVIVHCFPAYAKEGNFLFWLANIKTTAPPLPTPVKLRFNHANGRAAGSKASETKAVEMRFATHAEASAVVNHFALNPRYPCWCDVYLHSMTCPNNRVMQYGVHLASVPDEGYKSVAKQRDFILKGLDESKKPAKGWYHVADGRNHEDDAEEGGICEWYDEQIGVWVAGDCDENHVKVAGRGILRYSSHTACSKTGAAWLAFARVERFLRKERRGEHQVVAFLKISARKINVPNSIRLCLHSPNPEPTSGRLQERHPSLRSLSRQSCVEHVHGQKNNASFFMMLNATQCLPGEELAASLAPRLLRLFIINARSAQLLSTTFRTLVIVCFEGVLIAHGPGAFLLGFRGCVQEAGKDVYFLVILARGRVFGAFTLAYLPDTSAVIFWHRLSTASGTFKRLDGCVTLMEEGKPDRDILVT